ncbi:hypothetical protein PF005_g13738 [Phytophthora fragariae]|uniref:Uncharacterized protein n=1 Tax=Phytophthora fragariae TaxID=53985 RepID=A0A6A3S6H6_9STRA|nr:hypothetical protein PF007_g12140 [Phytophthora fragariae]KAE9204589.1 hypothetical protein PF005_g13738 [Phytophthora fragariae]
MLGTRVFRLCWLSKVRMQQRSPHLVGGAPTSKSAQESKEPPLSQSATPNTRDTIVEGNALHGVTYEEFFAVDAASPAAPAVANFTPAAAPLPIDSAVVPAAP